MKGKVNAAMIWKGVSFVLSVASLAVGAVVSNNDRKIMKAELKDEILKDMLESKND